MLYDQLVLKSFYNIMLFVLERKHLISLIENKTSFN